MGQAEWTIGLITSIVIIIVVLKSKASIVFRFLLRGITGGLFIYGINSFLLPENTVSIIALNPLTILTTGFLGIPGVLLLYAVQILYMI